MYRFRVPETSRRPWELLHLGPLALRCMPQIVLLLQVEPEFRTAAKGIGKTQRHRGSDGGAAVENAGERRAGYFQPGSGLANGRSADPLAKQLTGVRGIVHSGHDALSFLVIVAIIDEDRILAVESENHSPISIHFCRPMAGEISLKWMQVPAINGHVRSRLGEVESKELDGELARMCRLDTRFASRQEELLQPRVPERPDRASM